MSYRKQLNFICIIITDNKLNFMTVGHNIIQKFVNQLQPMIYPKVNRK